MNINKIGVFATIGTINSSAYKKEINIYNPSIEVKEIACPNWVGIVEGVSQVNADEDVKLHLDKMLEFGPDKIILGCTHYPYLLDNLSKFAPKDLFVDPAEIFVDYIKEDMANKDLLNANNQGSEEFYVSASPESFVKNSKLFYEIKTLPNLYI